MALALRTIASMGLLQHGFHKLFPAMAFSKQWGLWVGFVGFMAMGFGKEEKMGFVGRIEKGFILEMIAGEGFCGLKCWMCILYWKVM